MAEFSIESLPEVFVSNVATTGLVRTAIARGQLRKLASRLYTRNLAAEPELLVRRNWYYLLAAYFPDALITDRTALENQPAADGSVFLISSKQREIVLPGIVFRPRRGPAPLESDKPFIGGARLASHARAYLENMKLSRARAKHVSRTLTRAEIEGRLDALLRHQGEAALNRLRDQAAAIAPKLGLEQQFENLNTLVGALLGTREVEAKSIIGKARMAGSPFDPDRISLFESLFVALRETVSIPLQAPQRTDIANANLAFFDAYFSNFIEGTEFSVEEAEDIVFHGVIPQERPADAHDIIGTYRIVSNVTEMATIPADFNDFVSLLRRRHAAVMEGRNDKNPGIFKTRTNRAGQTVFVAPDLVLGTLQRGFEFARALTEPFQRAVFIMFLISEVHPFVDGNGRTARIMMNAELVASKEERIIIPTAYRVDYLAALKAMSHNALAIPLIRMLAYAQRYSHAIDWQSLSGARGMLEKTGAFAEGEGARLRLPQTTITEERR